MNDFAKFGRLLNLLEEHNETLGRAHTPEFLCACADVVGAEILWDGWWADGFGVDGIGFFPVHEGT